MATLDPRLLELIETLAAARLDWLAFELIEGIQAGRQSSESDDVLAAVRRDIQSQELPIPTPTPHTETEESEPLVGDDQIQWAAQYVGQRLDTVLGELSAVIEDLDAIVEGEAGSAEPTVAHTRARRLILASDADGTRKAAQGGVSAAHSNLPELRVELERWSAAVRGAAT